MENMYIFDGREIATIAISLANVMKKIGSHGQAATSSLRQNLHNLLIREVISKSKRFIFCVIAEHAIPILPKFDAR